MERSLDFLLNFDMAITTRRASLIASIDDKGPGCPT
jgi:hypothetical protein